MTVETKSGPDVQFWGFIEEGRFMIQRSPSSGEYVFYPRVLAPKTGATDLEWVEASGRGVVHAVTIIPRKPERGGTYNIALIDLEEGPRMMSRVEGVDHNAVKIGMSVKARVDTTGEKPMVVFDQV